MKQLLKTVARRLLGDYSIYRIYRLETSSRLVPEASADAEDLTVGPVGQVEIRSAAEAIIREQSFYCGDGAFAYAARKQDGQILGLCFFWHGDRYRTRNFWPLADREAKLVQIITLPEARRRGVAARLLAFGARDMADRGFGPLYARIWHSNLPSIAAFERAGWTRIATVAELYPLGRRKASRIAFGQKPKA